MASLGIYMYFLAASACVYDIPLPQNNSLTIRLSQDTLWINDIPLTFPFDYSNLTPIIGPASRKTALSSVIYTWDDHGLYTYASDGQKTISQLNICLFEGNSPTTKTRYPLAFSATSSFKGAITLGENLVNRDTTKDDLERIGFRRDRYLYVYETEGFKIIINYLGEALGDMAIMKN